MKNKQFCDFGRTNIQVPNEIEKEWQGQANRFGYNFFSKFLIDAVRYFIESNNLDSKSVNKKIQEISSEKLEYDNLDIDNDFETLRLFGEYFTSHGFSFKGAISGTGGLDYLEFIKPKIILLDILLPDISGYDVFKKIREMREYKKTPICFVTAFPKSEVNKTVRGMNLDPVGTLYLPIEWKNLDKIIEIILTI